MSVVFEATYEGETFEVEVFHDGHIEFPGRDPEYEQAMAEFTNSESAVMKLWHVWEESPRYVLFEIFEVSKNSKVLLAADYAERVLHLYEDEYPEDFRPRNAITATRKFVAGEMDLRSLEKAEAAAAAASEAAGAVAVAAAAAWAAMRVAEGVALAAVRAAGAAAAHNISPDTGSPEWRQARAAEVAWQIRRFVDVMEAIGQGFDWPPIEATP